MDGGTFIVLAVVVVTFFGVAYGLYSRKGSQINAHPQGEEHRGSPPGAAGPDSEASRAASPDGPDDGR